MRERHDVTNFEDSLQNTASSHTTLEVVDFAAWLVDVERTDDDQPRFGGEVSQWNWNLVDDILGDHLNVVLELGRNWDDRSAFCHSAYDRGKTNRLRIVAIDDLSPNCCKHLVLHTLDELEDLFILILGLAFFHQINLVLEDQNVLEFHDFYGG